ncbi:uncharacterized protein THITE_2111257 [Thermothielavioides terrestris NRRL 8126]|uniref:Uncharacterized protein n=1 Tax=Thermothielavioides terrestris (strain ATCC 38088 / NRRL 8126) TaxID=578455 RepID=G2R1F2_THETT|nr:uncharacterized protein THITE_2111257 [Thermothielavioides terrestris NRRL 8126]AEO64887.1 hypothetical protein THITE_2111257 [Thermothielavioides terrestris NRRL 8126]
MLMAAEGRRAGPEPRALEPGGREWAHVEALRDELRELRDELAGLVRGVNVGLVDGSARDGYRVSRRELVAVNEKVKSVLGIELRLAEGLKAELEAQSGDYLKIDGAEASRLGLPLTVNSGAQEWRATVGILL